MKEINKTLKKYFGFESFRKGQEEVIVNILNGKDTLVVMPTGGGKSLCYQLPALHFEGTALVISPLIALMQDQVGALLKKGIPAAFINSSLSFDEAIQTLNNARNGHYKLLYIAPERLENRRFIEALKSFNISFLAIDEAHCISEWGHDFRPSYLNISEALKFFDNLPVVALTATATPDVQEDIVNSLKMRNAGRFVRGFDRPNLSYITETAEDKLSRVIDICSDTKEGSTIIYCGSRSRVDTYTKGLLDSGLKVLSYHAGMADKFRAYAQDKFINGDAKIIVATSAFGMGIDKADVRNVIHCDLTQTLEAYYQEAGRAGRDGLESKCYMLYHPSDRKLQEFFINTTFPGLKDIEKVYNYLYDINSIQIGGKIYDAIFLSDAEIGNRINLPSIAVHSVINLLERNKVLKRGSSQGMASIRFTTSRERVKEYYENVDVKKKKVLEALLRGVNAEVFDETVEFDIQHFMRKFDINIDELKMAIKAFEFSRILRFNFPGFTKGLSLLSSRVNVKELPIDFGAFEKRRANAIKKLNTVQQYAETGKCKRNFILEYFLDPEMEGDCGKCSSCLNTDVVKQKKSSKQVFLENQVLKAAYELNGCFGKSTLAYYLKGKSNDSISKHNLTKGVLFGVCKEYTLDQIRDEIENALYSGYLVTDTGQYATVSISDDYRGDFKNVKRFHFSITEEVMDNELFEKLKVLRQELAEQNKVVPRGIISDTALKKIAKAKPKTLNQMIAIKGVGRLFINNFSEIFIGTIVHYQSNGLNDPSEIFLSKDRKIISEFKNGKLSLSGISKKYNATTNDVALIVQKAIESGNELNVENVISPDVFILVLDVLKNFPGITLRDLRQKINQDIDYEVLRIALAAARHKYK